MRRALVLIVLLVAGCTTQQVVTNNTVKVEQANQLGPNDPVLDVGIIKLNPGVDESPDATDADLAIAEVRRAEASFVAYHLKSTLESTANWGAVRVLPSESKAINLTITGTINVSDGERLEVHITATDATGRKWLDRDYKDSASKFSYRGYSADDPFQDLYNTITNDLNEKRLALTREEVEEILQVSRMRFALDVAPDAFSDYVETDSRGNLEIVKLPSTQDPMLKRVNQIREREYLFIDTLDDFYSKFYREMTLPYTDWREYTYTEGRKLREMKAQARNRLLGGAALIVGGIAAGQASGGNAAATTAAVGSAAGGIALIKTGVDRFKDAEIHEEAIRELSASLSGEMRPIILDVEGRTFELKGSIDAQYEEWRELLHQIYAEELQVLSNSS